MTKRPLIIFAALAVLVLGAASPAGAQLTEVGELRVHSFLDFADGGTSTTRDDITDPKLFTLFPNTTTGQLEIWDGDSWEALGSGAGLIDLEDLGDITLTSVGDNEVLAYDNGSGTWINQTAAEAGLATAAQGALADSATQPGDLATVATSGDYDDLSNKPTLVSTLDSLSDAAVTSVGDNEVLAYDNGSGTWINQTAAEAGLAAASHAHAASDVTSGTLAHERGGLEADVSAYGGFVFISSGSTSNIKSTLSATTPPDEDNDVTEGWSAGSFWLDVTGGHLYSALDVTDGAAVWADLNGAGSFNYYGGVGTGGGVATATAGSPADVLTFLSTASAGALNINISSNDITHGDYIDFGIADNTITLTHINPSILSGDDATLMTGTAGTDGNVAAFNADGDLVDSGVAASGIAALPVADTTALVKGSADTSKQVRIEVDGVTTATTRVWTAPDQDLDFTPGSGTYSAASHNHAASEITSGTLAHERGGLEADVSAFDGFVRISGGSTAQIKSNFSATAAPGTGDDGVDGYVVGSRWLDVTGDKEYVCLDSTADAAVWFETTSGASVAFGDLTDVDLVSNAPEDKDVPYYDDASGDWIPGNIAEIGGLASANLQDDDTFAAPGANKLASSESIKAYVDTQVAAVIGAYLTPQTLTDGANISYDASSGVNAKVTLGGDRQLDDITNAAAGMSGTLTIIQDGTGGRALTLDTGYVVLAGDVADIAGMSASTVAKIAWETHDGTTFYLWVTVP